MSARGAPPRRPSSAQPRRKATNACIAKYPPRAQAGGLPPEGENGGLRVIFGRSPSLVYAPSGWKPTTPEPPPLGCTLHRDYVFGYNGSCMRSVHFISDSECVYPVAALVVILDLASNRQRYFTGHCNDVSCVDWNEQRQICASGQVDRKGVAGPVAYVWAPKDSTRIIAELNHPSGTRWVTAIGFSPDGQTLVTFTGDDRNTIYIWRNFARWDGVNDQARREWLARGPIPEKKLSTPAYSASTGGYSVHSIFMSPDTAADGNTVLFYAVGKRHFKLWNVTWPESSENTAPGVTSRMGTYGKCAVPKNPSFIAFGASNSRMGGVGHTDRGTAWMVADNGHFYVLMGSSSSRDKRLVQGPVPLGCLAELPDGRWVVGAGDGTLYFGRSDPVPRVEEQVAFSALAGEDVQAFRTTALPRFVDVTVRGYMAIFGTANHALILIDLERREVVHVLQVSHNDEASALDHHPKLPIMATASLARDVRFWNTADRRPAVGKVFRAYQPVRTLAFEPRQGSLLVLGCDKGFLEAFSFPAMQSLQRSGISRASERINDVRFSADGSFLAAACWDQNVYLLRVSPGSTKVPLLRMHRALHGNSSSPTCVMFSANGEFVMSNSKDTQILFWRTRDGTSLPSISALRDTHWQIPWTCVMGWPVIGVWGDPDYDLTDVKSVCQSYPPNEGYLVAGDDKGQVKLFRFPNPYLDPPYQSFTGHATFVTRVRFSASNLLASIGADDHAIIQWTLNPCQESAWQNGMMSPAPYHVDDPPVEHGNNMGHPGRPRGPTVPDRFVAESRRYHSQANPGRAAGLPARGGAGRRPASADPFRQPADGRWDQQNLRDQQQEQGQRQGQRQGPGQGRGQGNVLGGPGGRRLDETRDLRDPFPNFQGQPGPGLEGREQFGQGQGQGYDYQHYAEADARIAAGDYRSQPPADRRGRQADAVQVPQRSDRDRSRPRNPSADDFQILGRQADDGRGPGRPPAPEMRGRPVWDGADAVRPSYSDERAWDRDGSGDRGPPQRPASLDNRDRQMMGGPGAQAARVLGALGPPAYSDAVQHYQSPDALHREAQEALAALPGSGRARAASVGGLDPPWAAQVDGGPARPPRPSSAVGQRRPPSPPPAGRGSPWDSDQPQNIMDRRWPGGQSSFYQRSGGVGQALRWDD